MPPGWLNLGEGESIRLKTHPSRWRSAGSVATVLVTVVVIAAVLVTGVLPAAEVAGLPLWAVALALVPLAALPLVANEVRRRTTWYVITDEQVCHKTGVLGQTVDPLSLDRVVDVTVTQSALDRFVFGKGDVEIANAGTEGVDLVLADVPDPTGVAAELRDREVADAVAADGGD